MSQLALHPMFKISTIHQSPAYKLLSEPPIASLVRLTHSPRYGSLQAWAYPLLSSLVQLVVRLSNTNVFRLLPGNSLITLSGPYPIVRYKISINVLNSSVSVTSEIFYDIVRDYKKIAGKSLLPGGTFSGGLMPGPPKFNAYTHRLGFLCVASQRDGQKTDKQKTTNSAS